MHKSHFRRQGRTKPLYTSCTSIKLSATLCSGMLLLAVCMLFVSCKQQAGQPKKDGRDGFIELPKASPISSAELEQLNKSVNTWYDSVLKNSSFNGGILVAKGGNIVYEKYVGSTDAKGKDSISATTSFHIASVSKTFTAMAVLKLCQDSLVSLDDEFSKYFPSFNYPGVTVRNLLNHRSGLPNYVYFMEELGWDKSKAVKNADVLDFLINKKQQLKNIAPAGTRFSYCNTNYALLALLIEKISGKSYPDFMQENYFHPLKMNHTYVYRHSDSAKAVLSYDWRGNIIPMNFLDEVYGDKNIYSTPGDLFTWDRALKESVIFQAKTLDEAFTPYSNEKPGIRNYGLGWRLNIYPDGFKLTYHNGWWHGNNAAFIRMIPEDATIIVLGNRFTRAVYKARYLCNIFNSTLVMEKEEEDSSRPASK